MYFSSQFAGIFCFSLRGSTLAEESFFTRLQHEGIVPQGSKGHLCHAFGPLTLVHRVPEERHLTFFFFGGGTHLRGGEKCQLTCWFSARDCELSELVASAGDCVLAQQVQHLYGHFRCFLSKVGEKLLQS